MFYNQELAYQNELDKDRNQIVRRYSLIRVFVANILGSLSFFHVLFVVVNWNLHIVNK